MRKLLIFIGVLLAAHVALLFVRPGGAQTPVHAATGAGRRLNVGVVFDVGGRGDKSFNDGAYIGAERAARELNADVRFVEPGEGSDREAGLRLLAAQGMDLVIGVGFIFTDDLTQLAKEYPNVHFAGVDYAVGTDDKGNVIQPPPNLAALKFREEQGSFLVGAIAALISKTKKVGFVGGMDIPLIHKFEAGYKAGVKAVCPDCRVIAQYAGVTPEAFRNPGKGKELALSQYNQGVDVIFHAVGLDGAGRVRGRARHRQAGHRRGRRPVCRGAGLRPHQHGQGRGQRRCSTPSAGCAMAASTAASTSSAWPRTACATCTTSTTGR